MKGEGRYFSVLLRGSSLGAEKMREMIIESLNIGMPKKEIFHGKEVNTGICKNPVPVPLNLKRTAMVLKKSWQYRHFQNPYDLHHKYFLNVQIE